MPVHAIFSPGYAGPDIHPESNAYHYVVGFYRQRVAFVVLGLSALLLVYGGGAIMFWFHSIYLGEGGPAISPWVHYLVDSTVGLSLTVPLALIIPLAARRARLHIGRYALFSGVLFALITVPGPWLHNTFVGRGTWFGNQVTQWFGDGRPLPPTESIPLLLNMLLQLAVGIPTYVGLTLLTVLLVRRLTGSRRPTT